MVSPSRACPLTIRLSANCYSHRKHDQHLSGCSAQEDHAKTAASAETHQQEAGKFAADKANLTGQILALRGDLQVKENELALARRRADLADSTQQLDRDEIDQLKHDADELQNEHAADLEYISQLELKRKVRAACRNRVT